MRPAFPHLVSVWLRGLSLHKRTSLRVRLALLDQIVVSGASFTTSILLVRAAGLHDFGVYSLVLLGLQCLAMMQMATIVAPMMSFFDQCSDISKSSYLGAVLLHQTVFVLLLGLLICLWQLVSTSLDLPAAPIGAGMAVALVVATQYQDLVRRIFYVTDRPLRAFFADLITYGLRMICLLGLFLSGHLTLEIAWVVIIITAIAALPLFTFDFVGATFSLKLVWKITKKHSTLSGWMLGNELMQWLSGGLYFFIMGAVLGAEQLGAVRAVQNLIGITNLLLQSLENFAPSAASQSLMRDGFSGLRSYVKRVSIFGAVGILAATSVLMIFNKPIVHFVYSRSVTNEASLFLLFGLFYALNHISIIVSAGLRARTMMRAAFVSRGFVNLGSLAASWYVAKASGVLGILLAMVISRLLTSGQLVWFFYRATDPARENVESRPK